MFEQIRANKRKTVFLIFFMAMFLFITGYFVAEALAPGAGLGGLGIAFIIWLVLLLISYSTGDSIFLAISGAKQIKQEDNPMLYNIVDEMKIASGLKHMPRVFIIDSPALNAFATGRKPEKASVAVTTGLLQTLDRYELQGVIAHEIAHINNRDILYMLMISAMMGAIVILADVGLRSLIWGGGRSRSRSSSSGGGQAQLIIMVVAIVLMILAPIIAQLIYFAVSRRREYLADASAVQYTRYPEGLANALEKISKTNCPLKGVSKATAPMYIANPLGFNKMGLKDATSTHPPISKRIAILRKMAGLSSFEGKVSYQKYNEAYKNITNNKKDMITGMAILNDKVLPLMAAASQPMKDERTPITRHRESTDTVWKASDYKFIACPCETKLKIPPAYKGQTINCPHCQREYKI